MSEQDTITPLKFARTKKKMTLVDLASKVESDTGNLSRIERGKQKPCEDLAEKLVEVFPELTVPMIICPASYPLPAQTIDSELTESHVQKVAS